MQSIYWTTLFEMMGSEKSLPYWYRLKLFVERKQYPEAVSFARGCMELYLFPRIEMKIREVPELAESWADYRSAFGVLDDSFLETNHISDASDENIKRIFPRVAEVLQFEDAENIYDWARKFFRIDNDAISEVAERLYMALNPADDAENKNFTIELPEDLEEKVRKFCNRVTWSANSWQEHFRIAEHVYRMSLPNEWEMLLQDCFYEGARSVYWWMNSVKHTVGYLNFYQRWKELKAQIGDEQSSAIIDWLENNHQNYPKVYYRLEPADLARLRHI